MPVNYYPNLTEDELLAKLDKVQKRSAEGVVNFTTVLGMQQQLSYEKASRPDVTILRILYSLHLLHLAGDTDAVWPDPYAQKIRKTRTRYT